MADTPRCLLLSLEILFPDFLLDLASEEDVENGREAGARQDL